MRKLLFLILVATFTGCTDGFHFETDATYQAGKSNLKVDLIAKGFILHGQDLSETGFTNGSISSPKFSDSIHFQTNAAKLLLLMYNKDTLKIKHPFDFGKSLAYHLDSIGYTYYNKEELEEFCEAIQLTAFGPKATYVGEQPEFIKVIKTDFNTY